MKELFQCYGDMIIAVFGGLVMLGLLVRVLWVENSPMVSWMSLWLVGA